MYGLGFRVSFSMVVYIQDSLKPAEFQVLKILQNAQQLFDQPVKPARSEMA